jgi:hypothetical protein
MPAGAPVENRRSDRAALLASALVLGTLGCNIDNPGDPPARGSLYFPNAMALSREADGAEPRYLFVANSNFDLRYRAGSVQAFSLERVEQALRRVECANRVCEISTDQVLDPDDQLSIGSFSTSLAVSPDGSFLFATTRTDDSLAFIPLNTNSDSEGAFACGEDRAGCVRYAQRGTDPESGDKQLKWPSDPAAVTSGEIADWPTAQALTHADTSGAYALVAHRDGAVSLFLQRENDFELTDVLPAVAFPLSNVEFDPSTKLAYVTTAQGLARVGVALSEGDAPAAGQVSVPFGSLYRAGLVELRATAFAPDARDLSFLPRRQGAGASLADDSALVVAQVPNALLLVDVKETPEPLGAARVKRTAVVGFWQSARSAQSPTSSPRQWSPASMRASCS